MKNEIRLKLEEFENKFISKIQLDAAVDKLGEEIAFDINQIELNSKE